MSSIAVIGAGLMGKLLAWRLSRSGMQVTVYERASEETPECAAWTAAAMVAPVAEKPLCHPEVFDLGMESLALWPGLLEDLYKDSGIRVPYRRRGTLVVAHPSDQAEMDLFKRDMSAPDIPGDSYAVALDSTGLRQKEPALSGEFKQGFWLPDEAQVDNRVLLSTLQLAAEKHGADFHFACEVNGTDGRYSLDVRSTELSDPDFDKFDKKLQQAGLVIDCRGAGARSDAERIIRGVRGETLWVSSPGTEFHRPVRLLHPRYHLYMVPRGNDCYQLGATELESDDCSPVSVRSAMEMLSAFWVLSPDFSEARILSMETNLRPATQDHRPCIKLQNNSGGQKTLFVNGLFRHGFLLAPALLKKIESLLTAEGLESMKMRVSEQGGVA